MRRLFQFSIRSLLFVVAAIAIICWGLLIAVRPYLSKRSTESYWIKVGAIGSCDEQGSLTRLYATSTFDRASLKHVAGSLHLYLLVLNGTSVTDDEALHKYSRLHIKSFGCTRSRICRDNRYS